MHLKPEHKRERISSTAETKTWSKSQYKNWIFETAPLNLLFSNENLSLASVFSASENFKRVFCFLLDKIHMKEVPSLTSCHTHM